MGSIDKLIKALENLKVFQSDGIEEAATNTSKKKNETENTKEKITNCNILADCMCSPAVSLLFACRSAAEFPKLLGVVIETLLSYANDKDSDVRMVSDESLNRITRALLDTNLGRLQIEFFKELKKNGPSRCVRSALWRFAELAPMIRLHKRRAFVVNLLSCVTKMAERHEEALQESLMSAMPNIASSLMVSATDAEVKLYIAPFLNNLCSTSAAVRRVASTCATVITLHSRKPFQLFNWLLVQVLDMVLPIMHSSCAENMPIILGCLHCIRHVVPLLDDEKVKVPRTNSTAHQGVPVEPSIKLDTTIMLFELMIHCLQQPHPSVITAALECYQQLLKTPTLPGLVDLLITPGSITTSILAVSYEATLSAKDKNVVKSNSELSIEDTDLMGLEELQGNLALAPDVDQTDAVPSTAADDGQKEVLEEGEALTGENNSAEGSKKDVRSRGKHTFSDSGKSISDVIGSLTDAAQPPILYSVRLICHTFLLTGNTEERLYADRDVRVSIKSLALSCLLYILKFYPQAIEHQLYTSAHCENQPLSDVLLYHHHSDPQIQGMVAQVLGVLIHARVHCAQLINTTSSQVLESYFNMLMDLLNTESAMTTRLAVSAIKTCINTLLNSQYHQKALTLLEKALQHVNNSYWLVKSELLELVSELDMLPLVYLSGLSMQTKILDEVVLRLLGDSDHRVRQAASTALVALIPGLFHESDHPHQSVLLARATSHLNTLMYPSPHSFPLSALLVHALPARIIWNPICQILRPNLTLYNLL
ncbi:hypothetical protein EB796_003811 [Bugula neritina]|uniref:Uncharacterized protein n=1 Tax=Bugula neritina TaxID=10212 RepID=A0A7J7KIY0_BUGNE|nr:hypothetical protein EB796_003811 [Bugula neritina]